MIAEIEVERGSYVIVGVEVSLTLPALARYLRRNLVGVPITEAPWVGTIPGDEVYDAEFWHWVQGALTLAVKAFREKCQDEWWESARASYVQRLCSEHTPAAAA